tara:strand:- start:430 stop:1161 length:732 start_codon:yes stop_codon:yes gene_type:complete
MQMQDLLIIGTDTFSFKISPLLESGFRIKNGDNRCWNSALLRGYLAHWTLENDSLFLTKVISGRYFCSNTDISEHLLFNGRQFASWYTKSVEFPIGEPLFCYMCIRPLHANHTVIEFENGIVNSKYIQSNQEEVDYYANQDKEEFIKEYLIDSLGLYLDSSMDTVNWKNLDCHWQFKLKFNKEGRFVDIELQDMFYIDSEDWLCLDMLRKGLLEYQVRHLELPEKAFWINLQIDLINGEFKIR